MRAYVRLDPGYFHRKVVESGYPPAMAMAMIAALCLAESQPVRGRFASERLLRLLIEEPRDGVRTGMGRWVSRLIEAGDLVRLPDGTVYLDGWDEWQEGDVTVKERMTRVRSRKGKHTAATVTSPVTADTVETVTTPSSGKRYAVSRRPLAQDGDDTGGIFDAYYRLTARPPSTTATAWLNQLTDDYGEAEVGIALASEHKADPDPSTLLGRVKTRLADRARRDTQAAEQKRKRSAIDEARELEARLDTMTPEERARADTIRAGIASLVKGMPA